MTTPESEVSRDGHGGRHAVLAAAAWGVTEMFTLSGAHVFPLYDAAVGGKDGAAGPGGPMRLVDVRAEASAVFAAEATAKLTRRPGLAVVTAGPGVTNSVSAIASAHFNGSPVLVIGGRAPENRWGTGALQELDHPPLLSPITKLASTVRSTDDIGAAVDRALTLTMAPHRGPAFLDIAMDVLYSHADAPVRHGAAASAREPDPDAVGAVVAALAESLRPVLVIGGDVWAGHAEDAARRLIATLRCPVVANGQGRGVLPPADPLLVTRARSTALREADLVIVVGTPLDFRLGYGVFGSAQVVHVADAPDQVSRTAKLTAAIAADLGLALDALRVGWEGLLRPPSYVEWAARLAALSRAARATDLPALHSEAEAIHPGRIYGELLSRLTEDTVVIGDGGDFVSFAGRYIEPALPGNWLDPGPFGCLGTGLGYAMAARIARPASPVVLLLGDGAAGFSLLDVDTLVRHKLPVVIVIGNNSMWGLEKHPMQFLYQYDVAAELRPGTRYDEVARALGADGEYVTAPGDIGPALDRAMACEGTYVVNVATDPAIAYPRSTSGV